MKAIEILKALCNEDWELQDCDVISTGDFPWVDLSTFCPFDSFYGNGECNTTYFYYWSIVHKESRFPKPDLILFRKDSEDEIYLWKIE